MGKESSSREPSADITIPIAGEHFGAGIPIEQQPFVERRKQQRNLDDGSPHPLRRRTDHTHADAGQSKASEYHLRSRSEMDFPEAYLPVARELWEELTPAQREKAIHLQAVAMEKVGFEKGAPKFFIEDFDPATGQTISRPTGAPVPRASTATQAGATAYPTSAVLGGMLLGAGAVVLLLAFLGQLTPLPLMASLGGVGLLAGGALAVTARSE